MPLLGYLDIGSLAEAGIMRYQRWATNVADIGRWTVCILSKPDIACIMKVILQCLAIFVLLREEGAIP